eukprot:gene3919-4173_t
MLRAAHLAADHHQHTVVLVVPWVTPEQQPLIYPAGLTFSSHEQQAEYILKEARQRTASPCNFEVIFYEGKYFPSFGSIFPVEDVIDVIPERLRDVAILEEPEHLNWFNHSKRWCQEFKHVVGIMHTNYLAYVKEGQATGFLNAAAVYRVNRWVCRIHCHKVVKLSDAVQKLPHQVTCNVHGVAGAFLDIGQVKAVKPPQGQQRFTKGAYFIGKAVWGKGYRELINLGAEYEKARPEPLVLDVIGSGEDLEAIQAYAAEKKLNWRWLGGKDHADPSMHDYQVFINPSTSDVVATTTAEALAMGKWAVVPDIACNAFFKQFKNCLVYCDAAGFVSAVDRALQQEPAPMSAAELKKLSWEAATERLLEVGSLSTGEWPSTAEQRYAKALWRMWRSLVGFTALREALGMTSASGVDEPELSEDEESGEQVQQEQLPGTVPQTARATRAQQELEQARSLGPQNSDWELDWLHGQAGTGYFYVTKKNPRNVPYKLQRIKFDPVVNRRVLFSEAKMK